MVQVVVVVVWEEQEGGQGGSCEWMRRGDRRLEGKGQFANAVAIAIRVIWTRLPRPRFSRTVVAPA